MSDYYDTNAEALFEQYQSVPASKVHESWRKFLPEHPGLAADIGAGSGRDSNWLASLGWEVIAVEPSPQLRKLARANSAGNVTWIDDKLPDLGKLRTVGYRFNLILLSAVWMHLPASQRQRAFRILSDLLAPGGLMVITLRHGSDHNENLQRSFHPVSAEELLQLSTGRALHCIYRDSQGDLLNRDRGTGKLQWETVVFRLPDDGTGSLPLLRHIIVNDDKSATYKLGLLRALVRIADGAPGIALKRTEDYVELPFGVVGLYWLKLYMPLVLQHGLIQSPSHNPANMTGLGFAKPKHFYRLDSLSTFDLRIGSWIDAEETAFVIGAISDACRHIQRMPANFITYPGTQNAVFACESNSVRTPKGRWQISKENLASFGTFVIPAKIWQTLGQYACWLEPAILNEWVRLMMGYELRYDRSVYDKALAWDEGIHDTGLVRNRVDHLLSEGHRLQCVWTSVNLKSSTLHIDHCFPWSRWFNNDLWNLLPASNTANTSKGDKLPSAGLMNASRDRILAWWEDAYVRSDLQERFFIEAEAALPMADEGGRKLDWIYDAMLFQRARIKVNQQLAEWSLKSGSES